MERIGRYRIEKEIGRGAMGVVYLAHDPRLRRPVALKTVQLPQGLDSSQEREYHERFLREARSAASLDHRAIVTVYDAGEDTGHGVSFIAMEYVRGRSLREMLAADGHLDTEKAVALAGRLAEALAVAHALVRDDDGAVKIADFGIARLSTSELTQSGQSLGSPAYMSPEQIRGRTVDGRSDLFSLAVILYETLTGERPFRGDDLSALAYAVVHETPVPATRRRPELPGGLDAFFDQALAKDPGSRFADGVAFKRALDEALRTVPRTHPSEDVEATIVATPRQVVPVPRQTRGRVLGRTGAVLVAVLAAGWAMMALTARATLVLKVQSSLESGRMVVRVDGERVYTRELAAERKKVTAFGKKLVEWGQEEFQTEIGVRPGQRSIEVEVIAGGDESGEREWLAMEFASRQSRTLKVVAGRRRGDSLSLRIE